MQDKLWRACIAEAIGTFFLCFIGIGAILAQEGGADIGVLGIALAHGLALAVGITAVAAVSGGHLNPAVTAGMLATGRIGLPSGLAYIVSQCVGAVVAALLVSAIYSGVMAAQPGADQPAASVVSVAQLGTPAPGKLPDGGASYGITAVFLTELVLTFLLVFSVFGTAVDLRAPRIGGFGVGLTVAFGILMGGTISGGAMNPARVFGPALVGGYWTAHWLYWVAPILGGVLAAWTYEFVMAPQTTPAEAPPEEVRPTVPRSSATEERPPVIPRPA